MTTGPHSVLARICEEITPKLNPDIMRGLANVHQKDFLPYLDSVCRRTFHGCVPGMVYMGYEICTPAEEYEERTRNRSNRRVYDFALSSIFMIKLKLGLQTRHGEIVPFSEKYLEIPYVTDGGLIYLSGSLYHIKPVLTNKVISPGNRLLFVRMLGTRKNFYRIGYSINVDGRTKTTFVVHAAIYEPKDKTAKKPILAALTTKAVSNMTHYLLLRYGYTETFRRYVGHVPVVGYADQINPETFPPDEWVIVATAHTSSRPPGFTEAIYESTQIRLAVKRENWDQKTMALVSELFYVIDHFPDRVKPEVMDNKDNWCILMGYIVVGGQFTIGRILSQMNEHLDTLDDFVDEFAADKLSEKGYVVNDFYDLAAMLTMNFPSLLADNDRAGNIYEKYYDVTYHVMRPITYALTRTRYALQKAAKRIPVARMNDASEGALYNSLSRVLNRKLSPGAIFKLASDRTVLDTVSYCGDFWYPQITSKIAEQEKISSGSSNRRRGTSDQDHLDVSMIEGGSLLFLVKADPTPVININPYVRLDRKTGSIIPNPELVDLLARTKVKLDNK